MPEAVVELRGIEKDYGTGDGTLTVLEEVDLVIDEGEFVCIVGASGSGKTTLMNILGCLDRPSRGTYHLHGEEVSSMNDDRLSWVRNRSIGFVFQSFHLVQQLTVLENVELPLFYAHMPRPRRKKKCLELLESVGLSHRTKHHPNQLSGGECQRVAVARSLVNDPAMLLADEPTGNLDTKIGREVLRLFHELHDSGRTIVLVTHNVAIAREIPRVVEMRDGRMTKATEAPPVLEEI